jgi:hypothetical protein
VPPPPPTAREAKMNALAALTEAMAAKFGEVDPTPEQESEYARFQKIMRLAMGGKTDGEVDAAVRMATLAAVKLVF